MGRRFVKQLFALMAQEQQLLWQQGRHVHIVLQSIGAHAIRGAIAHGRGVNSRRRSRRFPAGAHLCSCCKCCDVKCLQACHVIGMLKWRCTAARTHVRHGGETKDSRTREQVQSKLITYRDVLGEVVLAL